MKKWIESWLLPLVNNYADTPGKKKAVYVALALLGALIAWFGADIVRTSFEQAMMTLNQGALK